MAGKTSTDHHNDGQRDGANGEYEPPHSLTKEFFTWSSDRLKEIHSDNESYREGWRNAENQKK